LPADWRRPTSFPGAKQNLLAEYPDEKGASVEQRPAHDRSAGALSAPADTPFGPGLPLPRADISHRKERRCAIIAGANLAQLRRGAPMITIPELVAQALGSFLASETRGRFGSSHARLGEFLPYAARLTLECIGNSDALYHNIEHTMLVTLAGHEILMGRQMLRQTTADDYANFILACLTHDIGYVRGIVQGDDGDSYIADLTGRTVRLPRGSSDAALAAYHVDRSKLFVFERFDASEDVDASRIARAIEYTRFPYVESSNDELVEEEGLLLRAADLIGQLGDPNYLKKSNALFYEFEEIGMNKTLGYDTPADVVYKYPQFYWNNVAPQVQTAIRYLNVTSSGRQWIANMHSNVFRAEREMNLSGPQP
jgi:hypothetical protein